MRIRFVAALPVGGVARRSRAVARFATRALRLGAMRIRFVAALATELAAGRVTVVFDTVGVR
jgi:hypothetical protein